MRKTITSLAVSLALVATACVSIQTPTGLQPIAFPHDLSGTAIEIDGVTAVDVEIVDQQTGAYWDAATDEWRAEPTTAPAVLDAPGAKKTDWHYQFDASANPGSGTYVANVVSSHDGTPTDPATVTFALNPPPAPRPDRCGSGSFTVDETAAAIVDTDGSWFLPSGANIVGGSHFDDGFFQYHTAWDLDAADAVALAETWKFTTMRININSNVNPDIFTNSQLDRIVNVLSAAGIVSIITNHNVSGSDPTPDKIALAVDGFGIMAQRHANNPCVWFSPYNEPGGNPTSAYTYNAGDVTQNDAWVQWHVPVIDAIRAHSDAVIVLDETHWGQGRSGGAYNPNQSAALTYGPALNATYDNLLYAVHLYARWQANPDDITAYLAQAAASGLTMLIAEVGGHPTNGTALTVLRWDTAQAVYALRPPGVGVLAWHGKTTSVSGAAMGPGTGPWAVTAVWDLTDRTQTEAVGTLQWDWSHNPPVAVPLAGG